MLALIFASIGILCTTLVIVLFLMHNATPVVKSTTRELSYIILGGICACYASTFFIVSKPSFITCFVSRTWPPISFAIVYSALLTKTNRIARILAGSKKRILTKKPRFLTTSSQVSVVLPDKNIGLIVLVDISKYWHAYYANNALNSFKRAVWNCSIKNIQ